MRRYVSFCQARAVVPMLVLVRYPVPHRHFGGLSRAASHAYPAAFSPAGMCCWRDRCQCTTARNLAKAHGSLVAWRLYAWRPGGFEGINSTSHMRLCARKIRRSKSTGEGSSASKISGSRSAGQLRTRLPHQQTRRRLLQRPRNWRRRSGCVSRPPPNLRARHLCYRLLSLFLLHRSFLISLSLPPPLAPVPRMSPPLPPYFFSSTRPPPFPSFRCPFFRFLSCSRFARDRLSATRVTGSHRTLCLYAALCAPNPQPNHPTRWSWPSFKRS